ncbi:MAG: polysaccharide biosynthesis tyrosine autokinase [Planctomycetota bacterium]|nr:polysaccharide biosynthesis tyrosine autokinase [Planctomycetota bacterium]
MELKDYIRILRYRWLTVLSLAALVFAGNFYLIRPGAPVYSSKCHILVKDTPVQVLIETGGMPPMWGDITKETRVALIHTAPVLRRAVFLAREVLSANPFSPKDGIEPPRDESGKTPADRNCDAEAEWYEVNEETATQAASQLRAITSYEQMKEAPEFVIITARDPNPETARAFADSLAIAFKQVSEHSTGRRIRAAQEFIGQQIDERQRQLDGVQRKLDQLEREESILKDRRQVIVDSLGLPQKQELLRKKEEELATIDAQMAGLTAALKDRSMPVEAYPGSVVALKVTELQSEVERLERELMRAGLTLTAENPEVIKLRTELNMVSGRLAVAQGEAKIEYSVTTLEQRISTLRKLRVDREGLEQQISSLRSRIEEDQKKIEDGLRSQLDAVPRATGPAGSHVSLVAESTSISTEIDDLKKRKNQLSLYDVLRDDLIEVLSYAKPGDPISSPARTSWPLGLIIGLMVGVGAAYFLEYINQTVRTEYDVRRYINLPVLGAIVFIKNESERLLLNVSPRMPFHEVFNTIGTLIESYATEHKAHLFMVSSSRAEEGKSTVTSNVAIALARSGLKVILVDCDTRKSMLHKFFGVDNSRGLTTYLNSHMASADGGQASPVTLPGALCATEVEGLQLLPAGPHPQNPVSLLKSEAMKGLLRELREAADIVLVDVPPINLAVDTMALAPVVDGTIFLVSAGEVTKEEVAYAKRLIESARGTFIGCILNKVTRASRGYYYYYYHYYDKYRYKYYRQE